MGANAQTSVPDFTVGQILTAAQMTEVNTGIPVFADSTARDAAFGGTGEKTLAEGQYAYLEDTNETQFYDGASWEPVGASGLVYLTGATITAQTTFSLPNDTFTSDYRNYRFVFQTTSNAAAQTVTMRMRTSGTDNTGATYTYSNSGANDSGSTSNEGSTGTTSFAICQTALNADNLLSLVVDIVSPQETGRTYVQGNVYFVYSGVGRFGRNLNMVFDNTTQFDALSIISTATNNLNGVYRVYAYANS
jgi:hypothetical protein